MDFRPPIHRLLALAAFLALVASAVLTAWSILTDRADFGATAEQRAMQPANEVGEHAAAEARYLQRPGAPGAEEESE